MPGPHYQPVPQYRNRSRSVRAEVGSGNNHDHDQVVAGGRDVAVARLPVEMYRRRRSDQDHTHDQSDGLTSQDEDDGRYTQYVRRTQIIELCFHADFQARPDSPISIHFGSSDRNPSEQPSLPSVTIWDPPPLIPQLEPPSFAVEYQRLPLYPQPHASRLTYFDQVREWWGSHRGGVLYVVTYFILAVACFAAFSPWMRPDSPCNININDPLLSRLPLRSQPQPQPQPQSRPEPRPVPRPEPPPVPRPQPQPQLQPQPPPTTDRYASHGLPYDVVDMMMLFASVPAGLLGMEPIHRPVPGAGAASVADHSGIWQRKSELELEWQPSWAWSAETVHGIADSNIHPYAWVATVSRASSRDVPLAQIGDLLAVVCRIATPALYWGENSRHATGPTEGEHPPGYDGLKRACDAARAHVKEAQKAWADVGLAAAYVTGDLRINLSGLLRRLNETMTKVPPSESDQTFIAMDFPGVPRDTQDAPLPGEQRNIKGMQPSRLPPLTLATLEAFRYLLVTAAFDVTPENPNPASQYGGEEVRYFERICTQKPQQSPPLPGCQFLPGHAGEDTQDTPSSAAAWEQWAASWWASALSRQEGKGGGVRAQDKEEPALVALARHLTAASYLIHRILEDIPRVPVAWVTASAREPEEYEDNDKDEDMAGNPGTDGHPKTKERSWRWWAEREQDTLDLGKIARRRLRSEDALKVRAGELAQLHSSVLAKQKAVVVASLDGVMDTYFRWDRLRSTLEGLLSLSEGGDDSAWWSGGEDGEGDRLRLKLPSLEMMIGMIFQPLESKLREWQSETEDWYMTVLQANVYEGLWKQKIKHD